MFKIDRKWRAWNTMFAERQALNCPHGATGYLRGTIMSKNEFAHRAAWMIYAGEVPNKVDHINGVRTDNRIVNLRNVNDIDHARNCAVSKNCASGVLGVVFDKPSGRWVAHITVNRRFIYLGSFASIEEAAAARIEANRKYGFHENHGRAA
jgi:hypothetical protein